MKYREKVCNKRLKKLGGDKMSRNYYEEGYEKGYSDARDGERSIVSTGTKILGAVLLEGESQREWEDGYEVGYADGKED